MKQKLCFITGSRAEYGLLKPLMERVKADKNYTFQLIVSGSHLLSLFGNTYKEILNDNFKIDAKVKISTNTNTPLNVASATGETVIGISKELERLKPDLVILLGDRYEMLAAAIASHLMSVPVAHIHGGEITEGSLDDAMRHAITKLSLIHFTATEAYRKRVLQMGEEHHRVFNVGSLGIENYSKVKFLGKRALEQKMGILLEKPLAVVTFHPATRESINTSKQVQALIKALDSIPQMQLVITYPNADAGAREIIDKMERYVSGRENAFIYKNLGTLNYLSLLKYTDIVIGNSSSGIIEVPSYGIPTINIGERQQGRIAAKSVIHTQAKENEIKKAIQKALKPSFRATCKLVANPYDNGLASKNIITILHKFKNFRTIEKKFIDW